MIANSVHGFPTVAFPQSLKDWWKSIKNDPKMVLENFNYGQCIIARIRKILGQGLNITYRMLVTEVIAYRGTKTGTHSSCSTKIVSKTLSIITLTINIDNKTQCYQFNLLKPSDEPTPKNFCQDPIRLFFLLFDFKGIHKKKNSSEMFRMSSTNIVWIFYVLKTNFTHAVITSVLRKLNHAAGQ